MCDKYPRNYYAWTTLQTLLPSYTVDDILFELKYNQEFFSLHIKDYSALYRWQTLIMELHNRHYNLSLLQKLVSDEKKAIDYVQQVLLLITLVIIDMVRICLFRFIESVLM